MWIVLLDNSGSMGQPFKNDYEPEGRADLFRVSRKLKAAKEALLAHLVNVAPLEPIVLCTFNENPECLGTDFNSSDRTRIQSALADVHAFDGTDLAGALAFCGQFITSSRAKLLIVSDGLTDPQGALDQAINLAEVGATIFFILIDPSSSTEVLAKGITGPSGGFFWSVRSIEQLNERMERANLQSNAALREREEDLAKSRTKVASPPEKTIAFTAAFPSQIPRDDWSLLICVIYLKQLADAVQLLLAAQFNPEREQQQVELASSDSVQCFPTGSSLRIVPRVPGVSFFPQSYSVTWGGTLDAVHFRMRPDSTGPVKAAGSIEFYADGILVALLSINLKIGHSESLWLQVDRNEVSCVFISYSRRDSAIVDRFANFWQSAGVDFFRDTKSLRSGDNWRQKIADAIEESTIFQLFWSTHARRSLWVAREYNIALRIDVRKQGRFIRPVAWESPAPALPKKLKHLQVASIDIGRL